MKRINIFNCFLVALFSITNCMLLAGCTDRMDNVEDAPSDKNVALNEDGNDTQKGQYYISYNGVDLIADNIVILNDSVLADNNFIARADRFTIVASKDRIWISVDGDKATAKTADCLNKHLGNYGVSAKMTSGSLKVYVTRNLYGDGSFSLGARKGTPLADAMIAAAKCDPTAISIRE